jgi:hypothetical protein
MAYVSGFKHDIFISYAHADDAADPQGVTWVSDFQVYLKRAVKQHLAGYEPTVFFDALDLHPNHPIQAVLSNARDSAIFLPIISPSYIERPWPTDELVAFSEVAAEGARIFAVELLPPLGEYPALLRDLKRTQFWWKDEKRGSAPRKSTPKNESRLYADNLDDIAYLIAKQLREMQAAATKAQQAPIVLAAQGAVAGAGSGKAVLLAEVTDDLRRTRRQVREYLEQYQYNVLPKQDYPEAAEAFAEAFRADLAQAEIFVQLLSEVRSPLDMKKDNAEQASRGQFQYDEAVRKGVTCLQWRGPDVDPNVVTHHDKTLLAGPLVLAMGLQEFWKEIKKTLDRPAPAPVKVQKANDFVFINVDRSDHQLSDELLKMFEGNPDMLAMEPLFEGTPDQILEDLEANLKDCAGLLLVYGNSAPPWVRAQLRRYSKLEKSRDEPPHFKTLLIGPPAPKSDRDIGSAGGFTKIDCQNGVTPDIVQRLAAELRK